MIRKITPEERRERVNRYRRNYYARLSEEAKARGMKTQQYINAIRKGEITRTHARGYHHEIPSSAALSYKQARTVYDECRDITDADISKVNGGNVYTDAYTGEITIAKRGSVIVLYTLKGRLCARATIRGRNIKGYVTEEGKDCLLTLLQDA